MPLELVSLLLFLFDRLLVQVWVLGVVHGLHIPVTASYFDRLRKLCEIVQKEVVGCFLLKKVHYSLLQLLKTPKAIFTYELVQP